MILAIIIIYIILIVSMFFILWYVFIKKHND